MNAAHGVPKELRLSDIAKSFIWNRKKYRTKPSCPSSYHTFQHLFLFFFSPGVFLPVMKNIHVHKELWSPVLFCRSEIDMLAVSTLKRYTQWSSSPAIISLHKDVSSIHAFSIISLSFSQFTARSVHKTALIFSFSLKLNQNWKTVKPH